MCDTEGQDAGLARAGAGKDQQRALGGQDRLALSGIKAVDVDERLGGLGRRRGSVVDVERNELGLRRSRGDVCIERHGFRRGRHRYRDILFPGQGWVMGDSSSDGRRACGRRHSLSRTSIPSRADTDANHTTTPSATIGPAQRIWRNGVRLLCTNLLAITKPPMSWQQQRAAAGANKLA